MRSGGGDDRILSRHLANEQHSTFRGINSNNNNGGNGQNDEHHQRLSQQQQSGTNFDGLHPSGGGGRQSTTAMTNLPMALRRSMPSMNGGANNANNVNAPPQSRHLSFCAPAGQEGGQKDEEEEEEGDLMGGNYAGGKIGERQKQQHEARTAEKIRCTSAHSYTSLSPSGSLVFHPSTATQSTTNFVSSSSHSAGASTIGSASASPFSSVVDTRQIQVFLKKREDSRTTISTTMSELSTTTMATQSDASAPTKGGTNAASGVPPAPPTLPSSSSQHSAAAFKNSRKIFRSTDTRSSIFSVSSSLDSTKEERIIANLEHTPATANNQRVVVLPRPVQPVLAPTQSLQVDYGSGGDWGSSADGGLGVNNGGTERARSSSAELMSNRQSCSPSATGTMPDTAIPGGSVRRTSIDESKFGTNMPPPYSSSTPPPLQLLSSSSWHSISDLNSARHSDSPTRSADGGIGGGRRMAEFVNEYKQGEKAEIWHSPPPPRPQSHASNRRSNYLGELVWQVDETVYCGGIEAAQNQNLLCRLNIEYIVDLSGQEDDPTLANSRPRTEYPCLCPKRTAHSRMTMSIRVKDDSQQMLSRDSRPSTVDTKAQMMEREEIIHYFEALIDLIRKARISQKKVLIHSLKGRNRAPAFVAAYLMHCNRQTRVQAINKISKMMSSMRPGTCISDTLQRALMRWQSILGIRAESSRLDSQQLNKMFTVKRTAWN